MRSRHVLIAITWLAFGAVHSWAADLSKVDRTIQKEPTYRTNEQYYCLLVFGPAAKTKVWTVLDGTDLYVDCNGDGDLTNPSERFANDGAGLKPFEIRAGSDPCIIRRIEVDRSIPEFGVILSILLDIGGKYRQGSTSVLKVPEEQANKQHGMPLLGRSPAQAPICHFNGPLSFRLMSEQALFAGQDSTELYAYLGSFDSAHGCFVAVRTNWREKVGEKVVDRLFPTDVEPIVHPIAEIEFPAKDKNAKPIRKRFELSQRC